jgi:hypothetical protein
LRVVNDEEHTAATTLAAGALGERALLIHIPEDRTRVNTRQNAELDMISARISAAFQPDRLPIPDSGGGDLNRS